MNRLVISMAVVLLCGCGRGAPSPSPPATSPGIEVPAEVLRDLVLLATDESPSASAVEELRGALARGDTTPEQLIDELLAHPGFAQRVMPRVLLRSLDVEEPFIDYSLLTFTLEHKILPDGRPLYFLASECSVDEAVTVTPWWDMGGTVLVCPKAYQPSVWSGSRELGGERVTCDSLFAEPSPGDETCGCGPNLMRCVRDVEHDRAIRASFLAEVRSTVAHLVAGDRPLSEIFTTNSTHRDRNVEMEYRRWALELERREDAAARLADLGEWPGKGTWRPRAEVSSGQHSGIVTAPLVVHRLADRRQRMGTFYDLLWCTGADSTGATTETILSLATRSHQFVQDAWKELAAKPLCTNCHARMEYGWQFFRGFPDGRVTNHFIPELQTAGKGPTYGNHIGDPRGSFDLTPAGFVRHAIAQPEFYACMARNVTGYVFGRSAPQAVRERIAAAYERRPDTTARQLMAMALRAYLEVRTPRPASAAPPPATAPGLRTLLSEHCMHCHDGVPGVPDLSQDPLPESLLVRMLDEVGFHTMPKGIALTESERRELITAIALEVWPGVEERRAATEYFMNHLSGSPVHSPDTILSTVRRAAGGPGTRWNLVEPHVAPDQRSFSPNTAAVIGLEALATCKQAGHVGTGLQACLDRTISLERLSK